MIYNYYSEVTFLENEILASWKLNAKISNIDISEKKIKRHKQLLHFHRIVAHPLQFQNTALSRLSLSNEE